MVMEFIIYQTQFHPVMSPVELTKQNDVIYSDLGGNDRIERKATLQNTVMESFSEEVTFVFRPVVREVLKKEFCIDQEVV